MFLEWPAIHCTRLGVLLLFPFGAKVSYILVDILRQKITVLDISRAIPHISVLLLFTIKRLFYKWMMCKCIAYNCKTKQKLINILCWLQHFVRRHIGLAESWVFMGICIIIEICSLPVKTTWTPWASWMCCISD